MRLILSERFWFVRLPFGSMVKFQSLAQFPVDHLSHVDIETVTNYKIVIKNEIVWIYIGDILIFGLVDIHLFG